MLFNLTYNFKKTQIYKYLISFAIFGLIFFLIKFSVKIDYIDYYNEGLDVNIIRILERTFFFFFSPSVGIILTCPFLIVSIVYLKNNKLIKIIIILFYDFLLWRFSILGGVVLVDQDIFFQYF